MECNRCKKVVPIGSSFCPNCGEPINDKRQNRINKVIKWILNPLLIYFAILVISALLNGTFYSLSTQFQKGSCSDNNIEGTISIYNIQPTLTKITQDDCIILKTSVYNKIPILFPGLCFTKQYMGYGLTFISIENTGYGYMAYGKKYGEYGEEIIDECHPILENGKYYSIERKFISRMVDASIEDGLNSNSENIIKIAVIFSIPFIILFFIRALLIQRKIRYCINCGYKNKYIVDICSNCGASMKGIEQKKIEKIKNISSSSKPIMNAEMTHIFAFLGCIVVAIGLFWIYNETHKQNKMDNDGLYQVPFTGRNGVCQHQEPYTGERCKCAEYRAGIGGKCGYCGHSFTEHE